MASKRKETPQRFFHASIDYRVPEGTTPPDKDEIAKQLERIKGVTVIYVENVRAD